MLAGARGVTLVGCCWGICSPHPFPVTTPNLKALSLAPPGGVWGCGRGGGTCCFHTVIDRPGALDGTALLCNSLSSPSSPNITRE